MTPDHGTRARYSRGCRCELCRGANAAYDRELRARAGLPVHGTRGGYQKGCRCDECRAANAAYTRKHYHGAVGPQKSTLAKLEDLEFLLSVGEYPERAAARVGWSWRTATTMLRRHRPELAGAIEAVA